MACEVVAIPELYEPEQVDSARQSALFHLLKAAQGGMPLAVVVLAKVHAGLSPCSPMIANMVNICLEHGTSTCWNLKYEMESEYVSKCHAKRFITQCCKQSAHRPCQLKYR